MRNDVTAGTIAGLRNLASVDQRVEELKREGVPQEDIVVPMFEE